MGLSVSCPLDMLAIPISLSPNFGRLLLDHISSERAVRHLPSRRLGASRAATRRRVRGRGAHSLPSARRGTRQAAARGRHAQLLAVESAAEAPTLSSERAARHSPSRRLGASRAATRRRVSSRGAHSLFRAFGAALAKPPLGGVSRSYTRRRVRCRGAHSLPGVRCGTCQAAAWGRLAPLLAVESATEAPTLFRAYGATIVSPPLGSVSRYYSP